MNKIARIVLGVSLTVLTIASSIVGFSHTIIKQETNNTDYKNWMSSVADDTLIEDMNIPGTHDTMALYSIGDLAGKCQSLSLKDQLNIGVRFLDIRLQLNNNELRAVHGIVDQRSTFKEIALTVESFLELNSREFIIMSIKEENGPKGRLRVSKNDFNELKGKVNDFEDKLTQINEALDQSKLKYY